MLMSRRAKRMERRQRRAREEPGLILVSLIDIFTLLVFFLLIMSGEQQKIASSKTVVLPKSISTDKPRDTVVIIVNSNEIFVNSRKVASVGNITNSSDDIIPVLKTELNTLANDSPMDSLPSVAGQPPGREITIMGDREIPYKLLKKILATCVEANYLNISMAVLRKANG